LSDLNDLERDSAAEDAAQEEEEQNLDEEEDDNTYTDDDTNDSQQQRQQQQEEEIVEEKRRPLQRNQNPYSQQQQQQQQSQAQDVPGERLSRQEKRMATRQQAKPIPARNDRRNRPPQEAPVETTIERYSEVDNPSTQLLPRGVEASRAQQLLAAGELQGVGRKALLKAASRMQAYRTAFIEYQAQRDDYVIYTNTGTDQETGMDRWEPMHYSIHYMTVGQDDKLRDLNATLEDLNRAALNNDTTVRDVNKQIRKMQKAIRNYKLRTYFRMYIGEEDKETGMVLDPDDELQHASNVDVRDMLDSAEWCFQWVPKSRRVKPSDLSGSKADKEYDMIA
jgi:hypothetical protein